MLITLLFLSTRYTIGAFYTMAIVTNTALNSSFDNIKNTAQIIKAPT
jgi:hypothetical protein